MGGDSNVTAAAVTEVGFPCIPKLSAAVCRAPGCS